ncbi:MAG: acetyl-CoA carboxylase biotin carboxyl carrier protein [Hyphomicrobiales bacterium]|nr:acetyl-CoA carboxylase biotin carboxyl carrier protein [Hyphomicrobiales bacterium]
MTKNQIIDEEIKQAIKELTNMLEELNLSEIQIENDKIGKVKVARNNYKQQIPNISTNQEKTDNNTKNENLINEDTENIIKSPMVGTIYLQPEPDSDPFIKTGDKVKKGQTLLIVEAMKTMNDIVADKNGTIKEILVKNEQPVQFDDPLIIIE